MNMRSILEWEKMMPKDHSKMQIEHNFSSVITILMIFRYKVRS